MTRNLHPTRAGRYSTRPPMRGASVTTTRRAPAAWPRPRRRRGCGRARAGTRHRAPACRRPVHHAGRPLRQHQPAHNHDRRTDCLLDHCRMACARLVRVTGPAGGRFRARSRARRYGACLAFGPISWWVLPARTGRCRQHDGPSGEALSPVRVMAIPVSWDITVEPAADSSLHGQLSGCWQFWLEHWVVPLVAHANITQFEVLKFSRANIGVDGLVGR
jgi:hypothetical protein